MNTYLFVQGQGLKLHQRRKPELGSHLQLLLIRALEGIVSWQKPHSRR